MIMWGLLAGYGCFGGFRVAYFAGCCDPGLPGFLNIGSPPPRLEMINTAFFKLNAVVSVVFLT